MASMSGITLSEQSLGGAFAAAREAGRAALVVYTTSGHPDPDRGLETLVALADAGADVIELGIPFSDPIADGPVIDRPLIETALDLELGKIRETVGAERFAAGQYQEAAGILRDLVLDDDFVEFLTLPAYERVTTPT